MRALTVYGVDFFEEKPCRIPEDPTFQYDRRSVLHHAHACARRTCRNASCGPLKRGTCFLLGNGLGTVNHFAPSHVHVVSHLTRIASLILVGCNLCLCNMSVPSLLVSNRTCRLLGSVTQSPQISQILRARSSLTHSLMGKNAPLRVNQPSKAVTANTAECSAHLHANALAYARKKATYLKVGLTHITIRGAPQCSSAVHRSI